MSEGRERANQREEGGGGVSLAFYTKRERERREREGRRCVRGWSVALPAMEREGDRREREKKAEKEKKCKFSADLGF